MFNSNSEIDNFSYIKDLFNKFKDFDILPISDYNFSQNKITICFDKLSSLPQGNKKIDSEQEVFRISCPDLYRYLCSLFITTTHAKLSSRRTESLFRSNRLIGVFRWHRQCCFKSCFLISFTRTVRV